MSRYSNSYRKTNSKSGKTKKKKKNTYPKLSYLDYFDLHTASSSQVHDIAIEIFGKSKYVSHDFLVQENDISKDI